MSQQIQEQLSALMDGELQRDETMFLLRRVEGDRDLLARWSGYHVARQALRRQEILPLRADFAASIMAAIEAEAVPVAGRSRTATLLRWGSGGAIAASVAVAALIATGPGGQAPSVNGQQGTSVAAQVPAASNAPPPSLPAEFRPPLLSPALDAQTASATSGGFSSGAAAPIDPRLQSYLIRHYDAAGSAGQAGMVPYVLLIVPGQPQQISTREAAPSEAERQQRR
ncbi:sigma-E factor negative regulatory protein [Dokdonella sp. MW10]|uniref:sigma-E factor negative regulatory protein n=1 Tax=Dokdonella sp. MW10 TaxID=2992926 RepID=UPI003F7F50ED